MIEVAKKDVWSHLTTLSVAELRIAQPKVPGGTSKRGAGIPNKKAEFVGPRTRIPPAKLLERSEIVV